MKENFDRCLCDTNLEQQDALAHLERIGDDLTAKADTFEAREELLRERFQGFTD